MENSSMEAPLRPEASMSRRESRNSRVHFEEEVDLTMMEKHPIHIQTIRDSDDTVEAYLGFLQEDHKYEVRFSLPASFLHEPFIKVMNEAEGEKMTFYMQPYIVKVDASSSSNRKKNICELKSGFWRKEVSCLELCLEVHVLSGLHSLKERFALKLNSSDRYVSLQLAAQVMGKAMGTPSLKDGVKCLGLCPEADLSDDETEEMETLPS